MSTKPRPWQIKEITYKQVLENEWEVAILPIGACEPHGFHLPYGTDGYEAEHIADRIAERAHGLGAKVAVLPTLGFGVDANQINYPFAIDIRQDTLNLFVKDVIRSLEHQGIRKLVLFNSHGGNGFKPLVRELVGESDVFVSLVNWWQVLADVLPDILVDVGGDHANEMEAAVMLALEPALVRMEDAGDGSTRETRFPEIERGWVSVSRPWHLYTRDSSAGDPRSARPETASG